jgi:phospholipid/cholesterol/gamma-HCH transport system substrate-binding protein
MREQRRNYLAVGFFVLAVGIALVVWLVAMAGRSAPSDRYTVVYRNVMGLEPGLQILYEGYPVGFIEKIKPIRREGLPRYEVELSVEREFALPMDSVAAITAPGLLSAVVIDIRDGKSTEMLSPGAEITAQEATSVFAAVQAVANKTVSLLDGEVKPLVAKLSAGTPEILAQLDQFTAELNEVAVQLNVLLGASNVDRVGNILENLERASGEVDTLVADLRVFRRDVGALVEKTSAMLDEHRGEVGTGLEDLNHSLATVARNIDSISSNLDTTTRNMSEFSQRIRDNPGLLIRGSGDEEEEP